MTALLFLPTVYIPGVSIYKGPLSICTYTGCLNIHGAHVTANNSSNNNVVLFFCFRFENSIQLLILDPNALDKRGKNILHHYLETRSIKTISKQMQPINMIMIYYWDKKLKKWLHVLEADITTIKRHWFDVSSSKDAFFTEYDPNDHHCVCLSYKSLSY